MKKVVDSKLLFSESRRMFGFAEHTQAEQSAFVSRIIAHDVRVADLAAVDELCQARQLAESAFQIELVALVCDEVNVAFTGVKHI